MFSNLGKRRARKVAEESQKGRYENFRLNFIKGDGRAFDWGADYARCGSYEFAKEQGVEEFAPYVCLSDIAMSDLMGRGLVRTEALADGRERCDFRFKKGGETGISSSVPEVQAMIERIAEIDATRKQ